MNLTVKPRYVGRASRAALTAGCVLLALATGGSALALRLEPSVPGGQAHLSGAEQAARLVSKTMPVYPAEAKAKHDTLDGRVVLHVLIDEAGIPQQISVLQSLRRDYDVSALEAVRQWRWSPYVVEGVPSAVETTVTVTYSLDHSHDKTEK